MYSCTHWLRRRNSPPPRIWAHIRGRYWSARIDRTILYETVFGIRGILRRIRIPWIRTLDFGFNSKKKKCFFFFFKLRPKFGLKHSGLRIHSHEYETNFCTPMTWIVPEHRKAIDPDNADQKHLYSTIKAGEIL